MTFRLILDYWPVLLAIVALTAWLIRLESRATAAMEKAREAKAEVKELEIKYDALHSKLFEKLEELGRSVARIEGLLDARAVIERPR